MVSPIIFNLHWCMRGVLVTPNVLISGEMKLCNSSDAVGSVEMDTMHNGNLGGHKLTYSILKI